MKYLKEFLDINWDEEIEKENLDIDPFDEENWDEEEDEFNIGDKLICIKNNKYANLIKDKICNVVKIEGDFLKISIPKLPHYGYPKIPRKFLINVVYRNYHIYQGRYFFKDYFKNISKT